jgi:ribosome biogenesis protein BMS1
MADAGEVRENKTHRPRQAGAKADKRKAARQKKYEAKEAEAGREVQKASTKNRSQNSKAFGVAKFGRLHKTQQRNADLAQRKEHAPLVDRSVETPAPFVVAVVGPPNSGKSTLIRVSCGPAANATHEL